MTRLEVLKRARKMIYNKDGGTIPEDERYAIYRRTIVLLERTFSEMLNRHISGKSSTVEGLIVRKIYGMSIERLKDAKG